MAVDLNEDTPSGSGNATSGNVMVVTPNNRVEVRKIQVGLETPDKIEVRSGLNEGDMVVLSGRSGLQPGQEVRPKATSLAAAGS
jgi:membrane fusion protein (multidrug efflux system)